MIEAVEDNVELGEILAEIIIFWLFLRRNVPPFDTLDKDFFKVFFFSFILASRLVDDLEVSEW